MDRSLTDPDYDYLMNSVILGVYRMLRTDYPEGFERCRYKNAYQKCTTFLINSEEINRVVMFKKFIFPL